MTQPPESWDQLFDAVRSVPGSTKQQPARKTVQALQEEAQYARKRYVADVAVSMGAVDTGDDFDPYAALSDIAEGNSEAIDDLDTRITSLEGTEADVAALTHAATSKATPVDADEIPLVDSEASDVLKKLSWANLKAAIGTWYDSATRTLSGKTLASPIISGSAPASAADTGAAGQVAWDADYIYVCTATDTWKRAGIATW